MSGNTAWMVVMIVLIVSIAGVFKTAISRRVPRQGRDLPLPDHGEAARLRDEVRTLKERVAVLERIATDRNHLLEQEIEQLRDR